MKEQSRNRRNTIYLNKDGEKIPLSEICEKQGLNYSKIRGRMARGKTFEEAKVNYNIDMRYKK